MYYRWQKIWIVSTFEVYRCGSACCKCFVAQHGSGVYELLNSSINITVICILLIFVSILIEDWLQLQSAKAWQANVWFCSVTHGWYKWSLHPRHGFAWLHAVTQELGSKSEARFVTCFTPLAVGSGSVRGSTHCCQHWHLVCISHY